MEEKLLFASKECDIKSVIRLVEQKVNIHYANDIPLRIASLYGYSDVVKYLVKNGANIHAEDDQAVDYASRSKYKSFDITNYLLLNGADVSKVDEEMVIEYYSPNTTDNISRLYNLKTKGVDINKLKGIDISSLDEKFKELRETLLDFTHQGPDIIIFQYL